MGRCPLAQSVDGTVINDQVSDYRPQRPRRASPCPARSSNATCAAAGEMSLQSRSPRAAWALPAMDPKGRQQDGYPSTHRRPAGALSALVRQCRKLKELVSELDALVAMTDGERDGASGSTEGRAMVLTPGRAERGWLPGIWLC